MAASLKTPQSRVAGVLLRCFRSRPTFEKTCRLLSKYTASLNQVNAQSTEPTFGKGDKHNIVIPNKIVRSPTAVLEALASTVKSNANQPMYVGIDDPHLLCMSDKVKREYMAAMANGRLTAQKMISLTPEYFTPLWEETLPEAWRDPYLGYKYTEPCEAALQERISMRKVTEAIDVYKTCKLQKETLSQETLESLLELLVVFNCEEPESQTELEAYLFPPYEQIIMAVCSWKTGNVAEEVFHALPEKTSKAYCNLICGMASNFEKEGAFKLYHEAKALNLPIDLFTYNKLIGSIGIDVYSLEDITEPVAGLLRDMASNQVQPNVDTFDSILKCCTRFSRWSQTGHYAMSVLSEMRACGLEPQLSTYYQLLRILYPLKGTRLREDPEKHFQAILDQLTDRDLEVKRLADVDFFRFAMKVITTKIPDSALALKLHSILQRGENSKALGNRQSEYSYNKDMMLLLASLEHTDVVMEFFKSVVPYLYSPSSEVYAAIFENVSMHETYEQLPWLITDIQQSSMLRIPQLMCQLTATMAAKKHDPQLQQQFSDIVTSLIEDWKEHRERGLNPIHLDGQVIGEMIKIYLNNGDPEKAMDVLQIYRNESSMQETDPSCEALTQLTQHHIEAKDYELTKDLLELQQAMHCPSVPGLVEHTLTTFSLTDHERNYLQGLADDAAV